MHFDLRNVPFSRYGSYMAISMLPATKQRQEGIYLRNVRGGDHNMGAVFRIEVLSSGRTAPFKAVATPTKLSLEAADGVVELCMSEPGLLRVRGKGVGMRLTMDTGAYDHATPTRGERWEVTSYTHSVKFMLSPITGSLIMDAPWEAKKCRHVVAHFLPDETTAEMECAIEDYVTVWQRRENYSRFAESCAVVERDYLQWLDNTLQAPADLAESRQLAAYITWSCVVKPEGYLTRSAMYMSKNWMTNVWSWDHCFNAMALAKNNPELAWEQFMLFFDKQDESGLLPDYMNNRYAGWDCCKPPIHGWALLWMMERTDFITKDHLQEVYEPLVRWTKWWFEHRDDDGDGIPQYNHGNDSGWDNSTVFHGGMPVESPELSAFLIIQMETLSTIAHLLGKRTAAEKWKSQAEETLQAMIRHCWQSNRFVAPRSGSHTIFEADSLLLFMPIVLGDRLPRHILSTLVAGLKEEGRFLTKFGLATENINSPYYVPDGYWRGPIWAPATMLIVDGLISAGEEALARKIALRFCKMAAKNGMAENFNALTGEGLRDRAFTWTSSVFLICAHEFLHNPN